MNDEEVKEELSTIVSRLTDIKLGLDNLNSTLIEISASLKKIAGIEDSPIPNWVKMKNS